MKNATLVLAVAMLAGCATNKTVKFTSYEGRVFNSCFPSSNRSSPTDIFKDGNEESLSKGKECYQNGLMQSARKLKYHNTEYVDAYSKSFGAIADARLQGKITGDQATIYARQIGSEFHRMAALSDQAETSRDRQEFWTALSAISLALGTATQISAQMYPQRQVVCNSYRGSGNNIVTTCN